MSANFRPARWFVLVLLVAWGVGVGASHTAAARPGDPWFTPVPTYPERARIHRERGTGTLRVFTGEDGWVRDARMVRSTGSKTLDHDTEQFAVANWRGPANAKREVNFDYRLSKASGRPRASAAVVAYQTEISTVLGRSWYAYMAKAADVLQPGSVIIGFELNKGGKAANIHVLRGLKHSALANASVSALLDARLPPISAAVHEELRRLQPPRDSLQMEFTFTAK